MNNQLTVGRFTVKVLQAGDKYGLNNVLTMSEQEPLVEFYDNEHNQFVSRYYLSTMLEHADGYGLSLHGGIPAWTVSADDMATVKQFLTELKGA